LRNLLNRVRDQVGDLLTRDGDTIRLAADVDVDALAFEQSARAALTETGAARVGLARAALARYAGELLPQDRYDDWAVEPRERLRQLYLSLLDLVIADAAERGATDEAIALLELAIAAEPLDESRYRAAAALCRSAGREGSARGYDGRADAVRRELGLG
jgi:DNA-binding SARP family transcriptional activator